MEVNTHALKTLWHFMNERHLVYERRIQGYLKPWTDDPILQQWKFCNVYRRLDKTSDWLIRNVIEPHIGDYSWHLLFNLFVFRAFNWVPTYEALGWQTEWDELRVKKILALRVHFGEQLISGAYMIRGYQGQPKWQSIPETLTDIKLWGYKMLHEMAEDNSLEATVKNIVERKFWGWGPFMAYQVALDLTYTPILANAYDINSWCHFGPGAIRGLEAIFPGIKSKDYLPRTRELLSEAKYNLGIHMPETTLQDIEFSLCELQKYLRIEAGGKMKERYAGMD